MWWICAFLGALFAALTSILAKIGIEGIDSNLATAIRTAVVLCMAWGIVFLTGAQQELAAIGQRGWIFLTLSGLATGLSWLFFYKALSLGDASRVVSIDKMSLVLTIVLAAAILKEAITAKVIAGAVFITLGTLLMLL